MKKQERKKEMANPGVHYQIAQHTDVQQSSFLSTHSSRSLPLNTTSFSFPCWGIADAEDKTVTAENPELFEVPSLKPGVDQSIALRVSPTVKNSYLYNFRLTGPFNLIMCVGFVVVVCLFVYLFYFFPALMAMCHEQSSEFFF